MTLKVSDIQRNPVVRFKVDVPGIDRHLICGQQKRNVFRQNLSDLCTQGTRPAVKFIYLYRIGAGAGHDLRAIKDFRNFHRADTDCDILSGIRRIGLLWYTIEGI